jgi:hypothetical protein
MISLWKRLRLPCRGLDYASPAPLPLPPQGSLPTRPGSALVGRDLHPLDDKQDFKRLSHPSLLPDQQSLVALQLQRTQSAICRLRARLARAAGQASPTMLLARDIFDQYGLVSRAMRVVALRAIG